MLSSYEQEVLNTRLEESQAQKDYEANARFAVALEAVLQTHQGRKVLKKILALCTPDACSYAADPYATAFNEGVRQVGIQLKALLGKANFRLVEDEEI